MSMPLECESLDFFVFTFRTNSRKRIRIMPKNKESSFSRDKHNTLR